MRIAKTVWLEAQASQSSVTYESLLAGIRADLDGGKSVVVYDDLVPDAPVVGTVRLDARGKLVLTEPS